MQRKRRRRQASASGPSGEHPSKFQASRETLRDRSTPDQTRTTRSASNTTPPATAAPAPADNTPPPPPPPPAPKKFIIDQGTQMTVRLVDPIDSEKNQTGDTFHATLNAPLTSDGEEAVPAGVELTGHLVDVKSASNFAGQSDSRAAARQPEVRQPNLQSADRPVQEKAVRAARTLRRKSVEARLSAASSARSPAAAKARPSAPLRVRAWAEACRPPPRQADQASLGDCSELHLAGADHGRAGAQYGREPAKAGGFSVES